MNNVNFGYDQSNSYNNPSNIQANDNYYLRKWNWGAFMFNIFWGLGNKCYMTLLCLIPIVNILMAFVCGVYGNRWLWKTGQYSTPKELYNVQTSWNTAGFACFILTIIFIIIYIIILILGVNLFDSNVHYHY